tara:strand:- start:857 stop:1282 length:426 start_codon:yes stop_codon:yes gene_type:complete
MNKWKADKILGNRGERLVIEYLNNLERFKDDQFKVFQYQYNTFDLRNSEIVVEVKCRRVSKNQYPTTMIGMNKIKEASMNPHINFDFFFVFTDGLYKWTFCNNYEVDKGGRVDRGYNEIKDYAYIPVQDLELCSTQIKSFS